MPRDKTISHKKVIIAAKQEFLSKGFDKASMRAIGERAGMTSAGLYRHYKNKADMFDALVKPFIIDMERWYQNHMQTQYALIDSANIKEGMFTSTEIDFVKEVVYPHIDEVKLILLCSKGTKYDNFVHDMVHRQQKDFKEALEYMKQKGIKVKSITDNELHLLISAYTTALLEPIVHDLTLEETEHCLYIISEFFMPGWQKIMGF